MPESDFWLLDAIEQAGGCVVLIGTEGGERGLPAPLDLRRLDTDPLAEICDAHFGAIPDPARRPNSRFYAWLRDALRNRGARGILVRRYPWCDIWHAEVERIRSRAGVPVVDIDVTDTDGEANRVTTRIEAVLDAMP